MKKADFLNKDAEFILREELKEPGYYFSIIRSISFGNVTSGKIINHTGLSRCPQYPGPLLKQSCCRP
ncbi:hypothetical protein MSSAC_2690 [Methanosarcina siciliae C2J]|uniref:Uncharacterized protein n=1 Tax=Methanosarcina siciliae C2J TaxID=1434118 RepID=A0A0E3PPV4_9EURY|nr:hypothetical protein MSSAC_2690 [Methanosarcina siciliae C2J]